MNRRSVRLARRTTYTTYTHICPGTQKYIRATQRLEKSTTRGMHASDDVHISHPRGRSCPADENSTGIARRDAFSEIYAVVAAIFRKGHVSWLGGEKRGLNSAQPIF